MLATRRLCGSTSAAAVSSLKPSAFARALFNSPSQNPLTEDFPGLPALSSAPAAFSYDNVSVATLSNGLRVATADCGRGVSSLRLFVKAGSRFEAVPGTAHVLQQMAFKTTQQRSSLKLYRDLEQSGSTVTARGGRETLVYSGEILRDHVEELASTLAESVLQPKLWDWEVNEEKAALSGNLASVAGSPDTVLQESIMATAFGFDSPLGHSRFATSYGLKKVTGDTLRAHMGATFLGGNIVLAGTNVDHAKLVALMEGLLLSAPSGSGPTAPSAAWVGGQLLNRNPDASTARVSIALPAPALGSSDTAAFAVAKALLVRAAAASTKRGVSMSAFHQEFSDSGLFALTVRGADANTGKFVETIVGTIKAIAGTVDAAEFGAAQRAAKMNVLASLESGRSAGRSIGSYLLLTGKAPSSASLAAAIDAVSPADVSRVIAAATKAAPAIACIGSGARLPRYDLLMNMFK